MENESNDMREYSLFLSMATAFSVPTRRGERDYIVTQYLAEYIKTLGFDGVVFKSSLSNEGKNITVFNKKYCKFIGSSIYKVKSIDVDYDPVLPPSEDLINKLKEIKCK